METFSIIKEDGVYRMWYMSAENNGPNRIGYAYSIDGITWRKYHGNPIVMEGNQTTDDFDEFSAYDPMVIKDGNVYKMWYVGDKNCSEFWDCTTSIGYAEAPAYPGTHAAINDIMVQSWNSLGTTGLAVAALVEGPSPLDIAELKVEGPEGFFYRFKDTDIESAGGTEYFAANFPGNPTVDGPYTFTLKTNNGLIDVNSVNLTKALISNLPDAFLEAQTGGVTPPDRVYAGTSTPTFKWKPYAGDHYYYRVQIRNWENTRTFYFSPLVLGSSKDGDGYLSAAVPTGILPANAPFRWRVQALDTDDVWSAHNRSVGNWYRFQTGVKDNNATPDFLSGANFFSRRSFLNGDQTILSANVMNLAPWDIDVNTNKFRVDDPSSTLFFAILPGASAWTPLPPYAFSYSPGMPGFPSVNGDYTFKVFDLSGRSEFLTKSFNLDTTIPMAIRSDMTPADNSYLATFMPTLSWLSQGSSYRHRVRIQEWNQNTVIYMSGWTSGIADGETMNVTVPAGVLRENAPYRWYVEVSDASGMNFTRSQWLSFMTGGNATVSGQVNAGTSNYTSGNIYVGVYATPWPSLNFLGGTMITALGPYTVSNLPADTNLYVYARWDKDGSGSRTPGDWAGSYATNPVVVSGGINPTNIDVTLSGEVQAVSVSGNIAGSDFAAGLGDLKVFAFDGPNTDTAHLLSATTIPSANVAGTAVPYTLTNLAVNGHVYLFSFWDKDGDGSQSPSAGDYRGSYGANPLLVQAGGHTDIDITLSSGVPHYTAGGTYTYVAGTPNTLTLNVVSSDFVCEGPVAAEQAVFTVIWQTATEIILEESDGYQMHWTRGSGTEGDILGTWQMVEGLNSYEMTLNSDNSFIFSGNIADCGGGEEGSETYSVWTGVSRSMTAGGNTDTKILHFHLWAPTGTVTQVQVAGPTHPPDPASYTFTEYYSYLRGEVMVDDFSKDVPITVDPAVGDHYIFTVSKVGADPVTVNQNLGQVILDAPLVTLPTGHTLADANLGGTLNLTWTAPAAFTAGDIMITGGVCAPGGNESVSGTVLNATSGTISLPNPAGATGAYVDIRVHHGDDVFSNTKYDFGTCDYGSDTEAPTAPTGLAATAVSANQINLSWDASTDNIGVEGYKIYRDGFEIGTTATPSFSDNNLAAYTRYCYTVTAYDRANNFSGQSNQACATTLPAGFTEDFSAEALDSSWQVVVGKGSYSLTANPGQLRYYLEGPQAYSGSSLGITSTWSPSRTLIRPFGGDNWILRTKANYNFRWQGTGAQYQVMYIAFGEGNGNYVRINRGTDQWYNANVLTAELVVNGQAVASSNALRAPDDVVISDWLNYTYWYEISRHGQCIVLRYSRDGMNFSTVFSYPLPAPVTATQRVIIDANVWTTAGSYTDWDYMNVDPTAIPLKGDLDGDGAATLGDAILSLKTLAGINAGGIRENYTACGADVNCDGRIGLAEVIYILQKVGGMRTDPSAPSETPYTSDANTILLDHFDGATSASILAFSETGAACGTLKPSATPSYSYDSGPGGLSQALTLYPPVGEPAGSGTYFQYPGGQLLSQPNGTIEFWPYLTSYGSGLSFVSQGPYPGSCAGWTFGMGVNSGGQLQASAWAAFNMNSGATVVPLNTWTHVAATWGSTGAKLYINGVLVGSDANTGMPASGYSGSVLMNYSAGSLSTRIDELRISNVQRTTF